MNIRSALMLAISLMGAAQPLPTYLGRKVTITHPKIVEGFPQGPATICLEGPPQRQCYTAPDKHGNNPKVQIVELRKGTPALFFSAETGGTSGFGIHFALLRPGQRGQLDNMFISDTGGSNLIRHAFWTEPSISSAPIFVTADRVWDPGESHYEDHRYMVSAYIEKKAPILDSPFYALEDRYMTVSKYESEGKVDILAAEKQEILARLRRAVHP